MKASTNPNKLNDNQIDVTPLASAILKAHKSNDWSQVEKMLDGDYSLLWIDTRLEMSVVRLLASDPKTSHVIPQLLKFSKQENGVDSEAHRFVLLEAAIGRIDNSKKLSSQDIAEQTSDMLKYYHDIEALADMGRQHIGHLEFAEGDKPGIKPSPESIYHLCRGHHYDLALDHLSAIFETSAEQEILNSAIRAYIRGRLSRASNDWNWSETMTFLVNNFRSRYREINVFNLTHAEAISMGCEEWALPMLESISEDSDIEADDYHADLFGEAIISAARTGRTSLMLKFCGLARKKKLENNPRYQELMSRAVAAAVVSEHYRTAKVVMLLSSRFSASERDMIELCEWPLKKIQRLSRVLNDYKLFTEIVCNVYNSKDKLRWASGLKQEYGLQDMSDAGFLSLLEHPEGLQKLFIDPAHKYNIAENFNDNHLNEKDLLAFRAVMKNAKEEAQRPGHGKISFFRLCHLANKIHKDSVPPEVLKRCIEIKKDIDVILSKFTSELLHLRESKQAVKACQAALHRANTPAKIAKVLQKHLGKLKNGKLLAECMAVIDKPLAAQSGSAPSKV